MSREQMSEMSRNGNVVVVPPFYNVIITQVLLATHLSWIDIIIGYNYLIITSYNRNTFDTANHTVLIDLFTDSCIKPMV